MSATPFYGPELARIHDTAFGHLARAGAASLVRRLRRAGLRDGLVIDLGCGSGITAERLVAEGYGVLGIDLSRDLLTLARERVPAARFREGSLLDAELEPCVAVTAVGEVVNYVADPRADRDALRALFARARAALAPRGLLLFDVAEPGRERAGSRRTWHEGPGWVLCFEAREATEERVLRRDMIVFRESAEGWKRSEERHELRLHAREDLLADLAGAGFAAQVLRGYGPEVRFRRGHVGIAAAPAVS